MFFDRGAMSSSSVYHSVDGSHLLFDENKTHRHDKSRIHIIHFEKENVTIAATIYTHRI